MFLLLRNACPRALLRIINRHASTSTKADAAASSSNYVLFEAEKQRQTPRNIEKIVVNLISADTSDEKKILINKGSSTAFDVARQVGLTALPSALCLVSDSNGDNYRSLHSPLSEECRIEFVGFQDAEHSKAVNEAFWRSSAYLLGATGKIAFSGTVDLSHPEAEVSRGFFAYNLNVSGASGWTASQSELSQLSTAVWDQFVARSLPFETISVPLEVAQEFALNIDDSSIEDDHVILCRVGNHVDVVYGPVIGNTNQIGKFSVVKAFEKNGVVRVAGIALPTSQPPSSYTWNLLQEHAKNAA